MNFRGHSTQEKLLKIRASDYTPSRYQSFAAAPKFSSDICSEQRSPLSPGFAFGIKSNFALSDQNRRFFFGHWNSATKPEFMSKVAGNSETRSNKSRR